MKKGVNPTAERNKKISERPNPTGDLVYDGKPFFNLTGNARSSLDCITYFNKELIEKLKMNKEINE